MPGPGPAGGSEGMVGPCCATDIPKPNIQARQTGRKRGKSWPLLAESLFFVISMMAAWALVALLAPSDL